MICITKEDKSIYGEISLPASKSISNRLLLLQFYCNNSFKIRNISHSDDTVLLSSTLDIIRQYKVRGESGLLRIDARNAGSVIRFLVPLLSVTRGHFLLTGNNRMKQRPIGALVEAMRETGAEIDYLGEMGYPPLLIRGRNINASKISLDASMSSQYLTALLLLAPTREEGLTIELVNKPVSWPYVKMTLGILSGLGVRVFVQENSIRVFHKKEIIEDVTVESDWSSASFWYCMLSMADKGELFFQGLHKSGLQGDQDVLRIFSSLGVESIEETEGIRLKKELPVHDHFHADFNDHPDLALPVILACAASGVSSSFSGLERLRIKESDRLDALQAGLSNIGFVLEEESTGKWKLQGKLSSPGKISIRDFDDHRVAMTFAGLALKGFAINLDNPDVVNKSYPGFWKDLENSGFSCNPSC
jgi:3-phosphoshikimate 1-carboxyvinyltransferase